MAEVEERIEAWADQIGVWAVFQMMTVIAQVMELVEAAEAADELPMAVGQGLAVGTSAKHPLAGPL